MNLKMLQSTFLQPEKLNGMNIVNSAKTYSKKNSNSLDSVSQMLLKQKESLSSKEHGIFKNLPKSDLFKENSKCAINGISNIGKDWNEMEFLSGDSPSQESIVPATDPLNDSFAPTRKNLVEKFMSVDQFEKYKSSKENTILSDTHKTENLPLKTNSGKSLCSTKNLLKKVQSNSLKINLLPSMYSSGGMSFLDEMVKKYGSSSCTISPSLNSDSSQTQNIDKLQKSPLKSKKRSSLSPEAGGESKLLSKRAHSSINSKSKRPIKDDLKSSKPKRITKKSSNGSLKKNSIETSDNQTCPNITVVNSSSKIKHSKKLIDASNVEEDSLICNRVPVKERLINKDELKRRNSKKIFESTFGTAKKRKLSEFSLVEHGEPGNNSAENESNLVPDRENTIPTEKEIANFLDAEFNIKTPDMCATSAVFQDFAESDAPTSNFTQPVPTVPSAGLQNPSPQSFTGLTQPPLVLTPSVSNTINPFVTSNFNNGFLCMNSVPTYQSAVTNTIPTLQANSVNTVSTFPPLITNNPFSSPLSSPNATNNIYIINVPCHSCQINTTSKSSNSPFAIENSPIIQFAINNQTELNSILSTIIQSCRNLPVNNENSITLESKPKASQTVFSSREETKLSYLEETPIPSNIEVPCIRNAIQSENSIQSCHNPPVNNENSITLESKPKVSKTVFSSREETNLSYLEETPIPSDIEVPCIRNAERSIVSCVPRGVSACDNISVKLSEGKEKHTLEKKHSHLMSYLSTVNKNLISKGFAQCQAEMKEILNTVPYSYQRYLGHFYNDLNVSNILSTLCPSENTCKDYAFKYNENFSNMSYLDDVLKEFIKFHLKAILTALPLHRFPVTLNMLLRRNNSQLIISEKVLLQKMFFFHSELNVNDVIAALFFVGLVTLFVQFKQNK